MRKLCNTLYVTNPASYLSRDGEAVVVSVDSQEAGRIPIRNLEGIVCFGFLGASPQVMELCMQFGVGLSFVSPYGKFLAQVSGKPSGNILLRKKQYYISDDEAASSKIASHFIIGKVMNCKSVLLRFSRDHPDCADSSLTDAVKVLSDGVDLIRKSEFSLNELRGVEGDLSKRYFDCFDDLILSRDTAFCFEMRSRRPPLNRVNALLSLSYSLIAAECASALQSVGLDSQAGFLHRVRPGRPSLALDLMEEFRPYLGDRFVLSLINNRVVSADDFVVKENGAVLLTDDARKAVLQSWQKRKVEEVFHPFLEEKMAVGLLPYAQALLLARHLRGDIDAYPPFIMK